MTSEELNLSLRKMIKELEKTVPRTSIAKILLGSAGQTPIAKILNDGDFGFATLNKLASCLGKELHLVYCDENDNSILEKINEANLNFISQLYEKTQYVENNKHILDVTKREKKLKENDQLNDILNEFENS